MNPMLSEALLEYGVNKTNHMDRIDGYSKELGWPFVGEAVNWCGIFMSAMAQRAGLDFPEKGYGARQWQNWGDMIPWTCAEPGDVVVFWRESRDSWKGHVGLYINRDDFQNVRVIGGNQNGSVSIQSYDYSKVLTIRRPS